MDPAQGEISRPLIHMIYSYHQTAGGMGATNFAASEKHALWIGLSEWERLCFIEIESDQDWLVVFRLGRGASSVVDMRAECTYCFDADFRGLQQLSM